MLSLLAPSKSRIAVRVTKDAERHIRAGHPWIYDQSILSQSREGQSGDLAVIFDGKRNFLAIGLFDPDSPIRIKVLHRGKPRSIDNEFWEAKIAAAQLIRQPLAETEHTSGYRLINGENDGLPGLIVDRYDTTLVLKLYSTAWFPHLPALVNALVKQVDPDQFVLRLSRNVSREMTFGCKDGMVIEIQDGVLQEGPGPMEPVAFLEQGFALEADVVNGQKTGQFLDQRENRSRVGELSKGRRVLDVFACNGGFSLAAAAGGARSVHAIDSSPQAIAAIGDTFSRNSTIENVSDCRLTTAVADAFEELERLGAEGQKFDLIVIDPPSFAQKQDDIGRAQKAYRRLTSLGLALLSDDAILVQASCSSRLSAERFFDHVQESARLNGFDLRPFARTEHSLDHPVTFEQGSYLKAIFARPRRVSGSLASERSWSNSRGRRS